MNLFMNNQQYYFNFNVIAFTLSCFGPLNLHVDHENDVLRINGIQRPEKTNVYSKKITYKHSHRKKKFDFNTFFNK